MLLLVGVLQAPEGVCPLAVHGLQLLQVVHQGIAVMILEVVPLVTRMM